MAKITYATRIHVVTTKLINGSPVASKTKEILTDYNLVFHPNTEIETIVATAAKILNTKKEANKYHEQVCKALIVLGR